MFSFLVTDRNPEVFNRINTFFPDSRTEIELIEDIEEGYFVIFMRVFTSLSVKEAFEQSRSMFEGWELKSIAKNTTA